MQLKGVWLPIITPFLNDEVDYDSYRTLLDHYISKGVSGLIMKFHFFASSNVLPCIL